jgi:hypothetical protein
MYTTHDNLEHTIKLQEQLFRQRLRLRGIAVDEDHDNANQSSSSEHLYDNIDGETSDFEKQSTVYHRNRLIAKQSKHNITLSTDDDEQEKIKVSKPNKVRFIDQYHSVSKRKHVKASSRTNLVKSTNSKRHYSNGTNKKLSLPSNMLTVTIT